MIKNEKQYQVTKLRLADFEKNLQVIEQGEMEPFEKKLQLGAIKSQIEDFKRELEDYDHLKRRDTTAIFSSFPNLPEALIKGRIANGWSQADLAEKLGIKEQQIQRYESCNYATASFPKIVAIAEAMGLHINDIKATIKGYELHVKNHTAASLQQAKEKLKEKKTLIAFN